MSESRFPLKFENTTLLRQAFVHRSYANESAEPLEDNERLEFLGDAVLNFISGSCLYQKYPQFSEAKLSKLRAKLVGQTHLASLARQLHLNEWIKLGQGERKNRGYDKDSLLSDVFEAVIGAYFLDAGIEAVREFVEPLLTNAIADMEKDTTIEGQLHDRITDAKTRLQEWVQKNDGVPPQYRVIEERGEPHNRTFVVQVLIQNKAAATGTGSRKRDAEQKAAAIALEKLKRRDQ
jgi:ribonuclease-3